MQLDEFLHRVSVDTDVNIELLKDLHQDDRFWDLIQGGKINDAALYIRSIQPRVDLRDAQLVAGAFAKEGKH